MGKFYILLWFLLGMIVTWVIMIFFVNRKNIRKDDTTQSEGGNLSESRFIP